MRQLCNIYTRIKLIYIFIYNRVFSSLHHDTTYQSVVNINFLKRLCPTPLRVGVRFKFMFFALIALYFFFIVVSFVKIKLRPLLYDADRNVGLSVVIQREAHSTADSLTTLMFTAGVNSRGRPISQRAGPHASLSDMI